MKQLISLVAVVVFVLSGVSFAEILPTYNQKLLFENGSFKVPENWRIRCIANQDKFKQTLYYGTFSKTVETEDGPTPLSELPWAKEAIVRIRVDELKDPDVYKDLLENKTNPIMLFGEGNYMQPFMYPGASPAAIDEYFEFILKTKEDFGSRFLCLDYCEWTWGGVNVNKPMIELPESLKILGTPPPSNHDEAAAWWNALYDLTFKRYHDAGIPVYSQNNTSLNHYEARKGSVFTGNEISYMNSANDSIILAFCRGASRQFNIPWGSYPAGFGGLWGHNRFNRASPDERVFTGGGSHLGGAYTSFPLQDERRAMYAIYMAGGNFVIRENSGGMISGWDPLTIEKKHPRIVALQEKKTHVGPYGLICGELYSIDRAHDRGTPYTPIALMFDRNHGMAFKYSQTHAVGCLPYNTADEQMRAVLNTVFPYEDNQYAAGPFGEIFDVITTEASKETIGSYRALVLVGGARVDSQLAAALAQYVADGGLLLMACEQMTPELWQLAGIRDTGNMGSDSAYLRASDFYTYQLTYRAGLDRVPFDYHQVKLDGAEPLFLAHKYEDRTWPVATINRVGKGAVIVGTPVWMHVKGNPAKMLSLFSEIMTMIADELVPVGVYGDDVDVMYNKNRNGWVVTLMNNEGVTMAWPGHKPAQREYSSAGVILKPRFEWTEANEWFTGQRFSADVSIIVPPGEIRIIEFHTK